MRGRRAISVHCCSLPEYRIHVGPVGNACLPLGSCAPNTSAPTPLSRAVLTCACPRLTSMSSLRA